MTRIYSAITTEHDKVWLSTLIDPQTTVDRYREAMFNLGIGLGEAILGQIDQSNCNVHLACTVEDADFLAKGILSAAGQPRTQPPSTSHEREIQGLAASVVEESRRSQ